MRAFKIFVLTTSAVALSGPVFAQMVIDPYPKAQAEASVSPSAGTPGAIPEMPDQAALSPAAPVVAEVVPTEPEPAVHAPIVPDDAPPLPGSRYFKPVPVQEIHRQPGAGAAASTDSPEAVEMSFDDIRAQAEVEPEAEAELSRPPAAPVSVPEERRDADVSWSARADENLHQALLRWSDAAGVEVIWDCRDDIPVLESLDAGGSYTQAVGALLDQYEGREVRPVGQLHVDPQTRERILVVSLAESR